MSVSALMAVHNGAPYLAESLDSVLTQPEVTDVIVVDDGSTDVTPEILAAFGDRICALWQPASGQPAALNLAIARASGNYLAFQDADDIWPPGRIAALLGVLDDDTAGAFGRIEQFLSPDIEQDARTVRLVQSERPVPLLASSLIRKEAFRRVGPLDASLRTGAAIEWMSRARAAGMRLAPTEAVTLRRRIHATNLGRSVARADRNADLLGILHSHVARLRAGVPSEPA